MVRGSRPGNRTIILDTLTYTSTFPVHFFLLSPRMFSLLNLHASITLLPTVTVTLPLFDFIS